MKSNQILLALMIASPSDEQWMDAKKVYEFLDVSLRPSHWMLNYGSAEKNPDEIRSHCGYLKSLDVKVVITAAGLNPIIGRVVAAEFGVRYGIVHGTTVMCVPEKKDAIPELLDCPEFAVLTCPGYGKRGIFNACIEACKRLHVYDPQILSRLGSYANGVLKDKQPWFDVRGVLQQTKAAAEAVPIPED